MNFQYLGTYEGLIKVLQLILCGICKFMLSNLGFKYLSAIGFSYDAFMSVSSASLITTSVLMLTYIISENSMRLVRSSWFEVLFNACCSINFMSACSWLMLAVHLILDIDFIATSFLSFYSLMVMVNILGFLLGIFYGIDSYLAYKCVSRR